MKRLIRSLGYALKGLLIVIKTERNARIHLVATALSIFLGFYLRIPNRYWVMILLAIGLVWTAEIFNTAIENVLDLVNGSVHKEEVALIKDICAGAVLFTAVIAMVLGLVIFLPPLLQQMRL